MAELTTFPDGVGYEPKIVSAVETTPPVEKFFKNEFSFDDLIYLERTGMGLRHVSSVTMAEDNIKNGFYGDALALYSVGNIIPDEIIGNLDSSLEGLTAKIARALEGEFPSLETLERTLNESQKSEIIELVHKKMVSFINKSIDLDFFLVENRTTVGEFLKELQNKTSFMIIENQDHRRIRDESGYLGLGKIGKREYTAGNIKGSVLGKKVVEDLQNQGVNPQNLVTNEFINGAVGSFYKWIVNSVSEARNTELSK